MSRFELYVFFLCLVVFIALTALFGVMLYVLLKQGYKAIAHGLEDDRIKTEYTKEQHKKPILDLLCKIVTGVILVAFGIAFLSSMCVKFSEDKVCGSLPSAKVVMSESMAKKHAANDYLKQNSLDDQLDMFDLIFTHQLPDEFDLKLYDIVVYAYGDTMIIHRIVGIEEPNEQHPDCRYFLLQGDASKYHDEFPVLYSQMKAIYKGEKIPFIGSFFAFLQSPAGYLCVLLVIFAVIATPIAEKKLWAAKVARLKQIGFIAEDETQEQEV